MAIAGTAVQRAANAMLHALGGDEIALVLPLAAAANDASTQLGLSDPGVQQIMLSPVVVRSMTPKSSGPSRRLEFLISATAISAAVDDEGSASADALFDLALGIQYEGNLFHIESLVTDYFAGTAYLYRMVAVE